MQFDEVQAQHFSSLSRTPFPHVLIERALQQIAGGDANGAQFRKDVLAAAGWPHSGLVTFGKYPDQAAAALNRIRLVLQESEDPATILAKLRQQS
ncbi:hypothetical protein [Chitinimonas taiwanensis]|jgi:hypothetical protein|uniref:Uncharacterized protein n=1 Tax=Chitinimonas taiwanensis DSM 18899 TaxID=1121279 RepID=A0A1K2H3P4_9NEIS|nr:hypothetical protein [Chitinimonas taiwanensis]SFZ70239.1 hypothetical protein SAMN02745887_00119 [Chitinimonas taiwanensis DSM 18899]